MPRGLNTTRLFTIARPMFLHPVLPPIHNILVRPEMWVHCKAYRRRATKNKEVRLSRSLPPVLGTGLKNDRYSNKCSTVRTFLSIKTTKPKL